MLIRLAEKSTEKKSSNTLVIAGVALIVVTASVATYFYLSGGDGSNVKTSRKGGLEAL